MKTVNLESMGRLFSLEARQSCPTDRVRLTPAQRRVVDRACADDTKRAERPITAGFAVAKWERMMLALCKVGVFRPYPHGGAYELTEAGMKLGRQPK